MGKKKSTMKSKSKTKGFVWSLVPIALVSYAALLSGTIAFAQAVSFSPATNYLVGSLHPSSVAIGDLNGDGKPDLAMANIFGDNVSILLGTGTGSFGTATTFAVGAHPMSVAIADLNGDGKPDLATANFHGGSVSILLGTGTGAFGAATHFRAGIRPISVAIGDLNGDGKPDLATANSGFVDDVSILLGNGTGAFGAPTNFVAGDSPAFVAIGDLNADGRPDLAVANSYTTSNKVSILLGTGSGGFLPATNFVVGTSPIFLAIGDLNGDGKPDLAVANNGSANVSILLGTGSGGFLPATNFPAGLLPASLAIGDLNRDGKPDLAVVTNNNAVAIQLGTGTGAFGAPKEFAVGAHPYFVAIGDLNGDGKPDLAVTNRAANTVSILLGSAGECTPCIAPPSGLVSWWPGDGNANDIQDGNKGTLTNGATFAAGKVGQAFSFDGLGDYVAVPDSANLDITGEITLDAWIKTSGTSDYSGVVGKTLPIEPRSGYLVGVSSDSKIRCDIIRARPPQGTVLSTTLVEDGKWHHVACTYDGAVVKVYVDGNLEGSVSYTDGIGVTNEPLLIGRDPSKASSRDFTGLIDEVEVYNRALTQQEIQAIFDSGSAGKCKTAVSPNHSPVAKAGPDQTVEATSPSGASVPFNGSGSSDPDSNPLTYNWTGPFGTVSGVNPTVTLPLGTHTVTLTVNDGQATATDTVNITVRDTTRPDTIMNSSVDGNGAAVASGGSTLSGSITLTFGGADAVGVVGFQCRLDGAAYAPCTSPVGYPALAIGKHTFQVRALDAAGNIDPSPASFTWAVATPAQAIQNLINTIRNMGLPAGVATSLTAPLSNINTNNKAAACGKLNAFINQVNNKVQNGQLTPAQAGQLLQTANAIKASLDC